jgi:hypothetical protein
LKSVAKLVKIGGTTKFIWEILMRRLDSMYK